jgi:predicted kinase
VSRLLLITGAPASGKSTLAARLASDFDVDLWSKDQFKESLFDTLGAGDAIWSRRLSDASFALLFDCADRVLARRPAVLLEANFRRGEHEQPLSRLCQRRGCIVAQILCEADDAVRAARLAQRALDAARHPGHADANRAATGSAQNGFLELTGLRLRYAGEEAAYRELCSALAHWWSTSSTSD